MIKVANLGTQISAICAALPNGTVFILNGTAYILGKNLTSPRELPESLQNCRHRTALTGEYAGSQSMISNDALVTVCNCKLEITHEI